MTRSLFGRLLLTLLGSALVLWITAIGVAVHRIDREVGAIHDLQLSQTAQVLLAIAGHEIVEHLSEGHAPTPPSDPSPLAELGAHLEQYAPDDGVAFHVEAPEADWHFRSSNFPAGFDSRSPPSGYADSIAAGAGWRVYSVRDASGVVMVQVAQRQAARDRLALEMVSGILPPLLIGLAVTALVIVTQVRRARRPLTDLATALEARAADSLEPLRLSRPPREIVPIAAALDHLVGELRAHIERERRFTADAAHELRTPLASIHTDAEVALELEGSSQREALERLRSGAERAARLVDQLLTLARLDPLSAVTDGTLLDLGACAESTMTRLARMAQSKHIELSLEERSPSPINAHEPLIEALVRNLVENAIRCTPPGGQVQVVVEGGPAGTVLRVEDSGPGIPAESRKRVFERFYRGMHGTTPGSGLGLSISARIAALHRAEIELADSSLGGLRATVRFPVPDPAL